MKALEALGSVMNICCMNKLKGEWILMAHESFPVRITQLCCICLGRILSGPSVMWAGVAPKPTGTFEAQYRVKVGEQEKLDLCKLREWGLWPKTHYLKEHWKLGVGMHAYHYPRGYSVVWCVCGLYIRFQVVCVGLNQMGQGWRSGQGLGYSRADKPRKKVRWPG